MASVIKQKTKILFESLYKVAEYTTIHVTLNILTYGKLYLATLWSQRYWILLTLTVYTVILITKAMTSREYSEYFCLINDGN